jgi:hypothetical protein
MVETCPANGNLSAGSIRQGFGEKTNRNNFLRREILATTVCNTRQIQNIGRGQKLPAATKLNTEPER